MIHDATVEVSCDGPDCVTSTYVDLPAGTRDTYIARDSDIERHLGGDWWICDGAGHQFCSADCAKDFEEQK
jgi:hypothetical protein